MLQLSTSWYRSWIVNSTVCSVLACAWVSVATLSFLVWNRNLPYRWFECFHNPFDVLDSSRHVDSKRNSCFSGALWFCDRASFPFLRCILHHILCTWSCTRPVIWPAIIYSNHLTICIYYPLDWNSIHTLKQFCCVVFFRFGHFSVNFVIFMYFVLFCLKLLAVWKR